MSDKNKVAEFPSVTRPEVRQFDRALAELVGNQVGLLCPIEILGVIENIKLDIKFEKF